jgi:hypothetical protein
MTKVRFTRQAVVSTVIAAGAVVAFMLPAAAAVSVQSQSPPDAVVSIKPNAVRKFNGAVVYLKVTITCDPSTYYRQLSASVTEALPNGDIAAGSGHLNNITCTGLPETFEVPVVASVGGKAFKAGVAYAAATFYSCIPSGQCDNVSADRGVNIVNP